MVCESLFANFENRSPERRVEFRSFDSSSSHSHASKQGKQRNILCGTGKLDQSRVGPWVKSWDVVGCGTGISECGLWPVEISELEGMGNGMPLQFPNINLNKSDNAERKITSWV